jgi:hypothetical protein
MNVRQKLDPTPEGRIAAAVRIAIFKLAARRGLPANFERCLPDYADLREEIAAIVRREILEAELRAVIVAPENRDRRQQEILQELAGIL